MENGDIICLESVESTNSYMSMRAHGMSHGTMVTARSQTAGRGQRGNSWESAPGENVTMSLLLLPEGLDARSQFLISEAVAVGTAETLRHYLGADCGAGVKWPNDVYVGDRKICGILIENVLTGSRVSRSIAGVGLNVNQRRFVSDAPNPVSMFQISGRHLDVDEVAATLRANILAVYADARADGGAARLHSRYMSMLWRRKGMYPYTDTSTGERFMARIEDVALTGHLTLCDDAGLSRTYAFKEVSAVSGE